MKDKSYCFDFGFTNQITIVGKYYIYFKDNVLALLGNAKEVNIGLDKQNKTMLIKPLDERLQAKKYNIKNNKTYCNKLLAEIRKITDKKEFAVVFDKDVGGLLVKLGE